MDDKGGGHATGRNNNILSDRHRALLNTSHSRIKDRIINILLRRHGLNKRTIMGNHTLNNVNSSRLTQNSLQKRSQTGAPRILHILNNQVNRRVPTLLILLTSRDIMIRQIRRSGKQYRINRTRGHNNTTRRVGLTHINRINHNGTINNRVTNHRGTKRVLTHTVANSRLLLGNSIRTMNRAIISMHNRNNNVIDRLTKGTSMIDSHTSQNHNSKRHRDKLKLDHTFNSYHNNIDLKKRLRVLGNIKDNQGIKRHTLSIGHLLKQTSGTKSTMNQGTITQNHSNNRQDEGTTNTTKGGINMRLTINRGQTGDNNLLLSLDKHFDRLLLSFRRKLHRLSLLIKRDLRLLIANFIENLTIFNSDNRLDLRFLNSFVGFDRVDFLLGVKGDIVGALGYDNVSLVPNISLSLDHRHYLSKDRRALNLATKRSHHVPRRAIGVSGQLGTIGDLVGLVNKGGLNRSHFEVKQRNRRTSLKRLNGSVGQMLSVNLFRILKIMSSTSTRPNSRPIGRDPISIEELASSLTRLTLSLRTLIILNGTRPPTGERTRAVIIGRRKKGNPKLSRVTRDTKNSKRTTIISTSRGKNVTLGGPPIFDNKYLGVDQRISGLLFRSLVALPRSNRPLFTAFPERRDKTDTIYTMDSSTPSHKSVFSERHASLQLVVPF